MKDSSKTKVNDDYSIDLLKKLEIGCIFNLFKFDSIFYKFNTLSSNLKI
jgi:hypothetical protein